MTELARAEVEGTVICGLMQASCICTREPGHPDDYHECLRPGCGGRWRIVNDELVPVRFPYAEGMGPLQDARFGLMPPAYDPAQT
jgi:hypothetical protein